MTTCSRILMVVGNPAMTPGGDRVGFQASELTHPYFAFSEAGAQITIASNDGGKVEFDAYSDPRHPSGHSAHDYVSVGFIHSPGLMSQLENTPPVAGLELSDYDAIFVAGGSSPMFTFKSAKPLQDLFMAFHQSGKPVCTLCHGSALLLFLKNPNGEPFVKGRRFTGSSNAKEELFAKKMGRDYFPFRIEDEARKLGAHFEANPEPLVSFAVADGNLIRGQQGHSGFETARLALLHFENVKAAGGTTHERIRHPRRD